MSQKLLLYLTFVIFVPGLVLIDTTIAQPANLYTRWPLNEGEGEMVFDISGNDLHGMIQNADNGLGPDGSVWVEDPVRGTVISCTVYFHFRSLTLSGANNLCRL